jgi:DNA-directed RNA polymerase specialized sigma24 family protein
MTSDTGGSVTRWIAALRGGEADDAARRLWDRYFDRLVGLARARLRSAPRGPDDEEDAALSAFESLCRGVAQGRFERLSNRDELWRLLATITARKAADRIEREGRQKRGGGRVRGEAELVGKDGAELDRLADSGPDPAFVAMMGEEVRRLFDSLPDESLRLIALLRLEGYTTEEIASSLDCAARSVNRKLERIRLLWSQEREPL